VKGTFFEVGRAIDAEPQITRARSTSHGQLLGNHSYAHDEWRWLDPRYPRLERTQNAFRRAIRTCPAYYRPPHGNRTPFVAHVVNDHHVRIVIVERVSQRLGREESRNHRAQGRGAREAGSIILLHDGLDGHPSCRPDGARAGVAPDPRRPAGEAPSTPSGSTT
jgi:peptidoglycan/xylan/chitin deacetylase (PgdA/CDA1 family)